jgi:hypothetical protein
MDRYFSADGLLDPPGADSGQASGPESLNKTNKLQDSQQLISHFLFCLLSFYFYLPAFWCPEPELY